MIDHIKILSKDYIDNDIKYMNDNIIYLNNLLVSILKSYKIDTNKCDININYFSPLLYRPNITINLPNSIDDISDNIKVNITISIKKNILISYPEDIEYNILKKFKQMLDNNLNKMGLYVDLSLIHTIEENTLIITCDYNPQKYEKLIYVLINKYRKELLTKLKKK